MRISPQDESGTVTLRELSDRIENAFLGTSASKADLLNAALASDAGPGVFAALNQLPEQRFSSVLDVWSHLADLPFDQLGPGQPGRTVRTG